MLRCPVHSNHVTFPNCLAKLTRNKVQIKVSKINMHQLFTCMGSISRLMPCVCSYTFIITKSINNFLFANKYWNNVWKENNKLPTL